MSRIIAKLSALLKLSLVMRITLAVFFVLLICIVFIGLDNATGIVLGWLAVALLIVALVRKWRKPGYFFILLIGSFLGAILLAGIYVEVARPLAEWIGGVNVAESTGWRIFHVIVSNVILLGTPVGIFIGFTGFIIMSIWRIYDWRRRRNAGVT